MRFETGDCARILPELFEKGALPDVIVLDPPRAGCEASLLNAIIKTNVPRIVYVSCDPATLARDLAVFRRQINAERVQILDMFPYDGTCRVRGLALKESNM